MRFCLTVGGGVLLAVLVLFVAFGPGVRTILDALLIAGAAFPAIVRHIPKLHLAITKTWYAITNTSATWELQVRFSGIRDQRSPKLLGRALISWAGGDSSFVSQAQDRCVLRIGHRFVLDVYAPAQRDGMLPGGVDDSEVSISVAPVTVGYRNSRRFLDKELLPLLERCSTELRASRALYGLKVGFPGANPFYGIYIQRLRLSSVREFKIEFQLSPLQGSGRIVVGKKGIEVVSESVSGLRSAASAALAFQMPEVEPCL